MRTLTFNGFLKNYLKQLSGVETESVRTLLKMAEENPRLKAPLLLYVVAGLPKEPRMDALKANPALQKEYETYFDTIHTQADFLNRLAGGALPEEYNKVYHSFIRKRDKLATEQQVKELLRQKSLLLKKQKNISDYRIYSSLGLNAGNYHSFMRQGRMTTLSYANAKRVLAYLEKQNPSAQQPLGETCLEKDFAV